MIGGRAAIAGQEPFEQVGAHALILVLPEVVSYEIILCEIR